VRNQLGEEVVFAGRCGGFIDGCDFEGGSCKTNIDRGREAELGGANVGNLHSCIIPKHEDAPSGAGRWPFSKTLQCSSGLRCS
jgi:hypothetical protein